MNLSDYNISTLGIIKNHKCPNCGKTERFSDKERYNLAECIMNNSVGIWALVHCGHCGYVDTIYPTRINGITCTPKDCERLMDEINRKAGEQE